MCGILHFIYFLKGKEEKHNYVFIALNPKYNYTAEFISP